MILQLSFLLFSLQTSKRERVGVSVALLAINRLAKKPKLNVESLVYRYGLLIGRTSNLSVIFQELLGIGDIEKSQRGEWFAEMIVVLDILNREVFEGWA